MEYYTACFFGHRKIDETDELKTKLYRIIENLIVNEKVDTFLFGSKSHFDNLCYDIVSELKTEHPEIKRIYVRAENEYIDGEGSRAYREGLYELYEDTYFPEYVSRAGKAAYVERNREMINKAEFCIVYYNKDYLPPRRKNSKRDLTDYQPKSGTAAAYGYAISKKKTIINIFEKSVPKWMLNFSQKNNKMKQTFAYMTSFLLTYGNQHLVLAIFEKYSFWLIDVI